MARHWSNGLWVAAALFSWPGAVCFNTSVSAADLNPDEPSGELVKEALHRDLYGLRADRDRLLDTALQQDPDHAPARWHQGFVSYRGTWKTAAEIPQLLAEHAAFNEYSNRRESVDDDLAGNLNLANWCRKYHLPAQERAHLNRVLDFEPDHAQARSRLGFRMIDGQWKTTAELRREAEQAEQQRKSLARWRGKIERLRNSLRQRDDDRRLRAAARVRGIRDPSAIVALETILADSERGALLVVETISDMAGEESVLALIRQAVRSPWQPIREAAARALGRREQAYYVPVMLDELFTPVTSQAELVPDGNRFIYRHAFRREGQDQQQELVLDTRYQRLARAGGDRRDTLMRAMAGTMSMALARERTVAEQNRFAAQLNQRIFSALSLATGQQLPPSPQSWWQWWQDDQDVVLQGEKQTRRIQRTTQVALVDRVQTTPGGIQLSGTPRRQRAECFAAGTPVWTAAGVLPIETIRVGDLVLSQDPTTGELTYKPILRTTIRPPEQLVKVEVGSAQFETSAGHLFWVAGHGWMRSRDLRSGMRLHALGGSRPVFEVRTGDKEQTFNLVVADFGTYFVGPEKILSHDVTAQRPTAAILPGLIDQ